MITNAQRQIREICDWILRQLQSSGSQGALLEIRGDLNSAVAAALVKSAAEKIIAVIISCATLQSDLDDARLVVEHLGLGYERMDLNGTYGSFLSILPKAESPIHADLKLRIRTAAIRYLAASRNMLVIGAMDRTDRVTGHLPMLSDDAADLFPMVHLLKSDIREIARTLGLPERIIDKTLVLEWQTEKPLEFRQSLRYEELDAYLSGDFMAVTKDAQRSIRTMQQELSLKRRYPLCFSSAISTTDHDTTAYQDHETYDKSIEALSLISKAITSDQYLEDILRLIVMVTAEVMRSSVCSLWLLDDKEGVLRLRATQSIDREYLKDRVLRIGEGVVGKVVAENRPHVVTNVLEDQFFKEKELARRMGLVSMLSVPMRVKDRVIGVINCYTSHPHVFSDLQMNVLTTVANQAAVAIEKTELMVQTKVIQEELERRKIIERAKDLLMKRLDLSGEEAYRWLQKRSMNTRKSMREVSEAVLLAMEG